MQPVEIRMGSRLLVLARPGTLPPAMLRASDGLGLGAALAQLNHDPGAVRRLRQSWNSLVPSRRSSALPRPELIDALRREIAARRISASLLHTDRWPNAASDKLPDPPAPAGYISIDLSSGLLVIARQGGLPREVRGQVGREEAARALGALPLGSRGLTQLAAQSWHLGRPTPLQQIEALRHALTVGLRHGTYDGAVLTTPQSLRSAPRPPGVGRSVRGQSAVERVGEALLRSRGHLSGALLETVEQMVTPQALGIMTGAFAAIGLAQLYPLAGAAVDAGLLALAWLSAGWAGIVAVRDLAEATIAAMNATGDAELDAAARQYARAFVALGAMLLAELTARLVRKPPARAAEEPLKRSPPPRSSPPQPKPSEPPPPAPPKPAPPAKAAELPATVPPKRLPHHRTDLADEWYDSKTGEMRWPPEDGFDPGTRKPDVLKPGYVMDRYGGPFGNYTAPPGTPFAERALPYDVSKMPYKQYEVLRDLPVESGKIAPWFGDPGGGIQYKTPMTIQQMLDAVPPYIKEVTRP